MTDYKDRLKEHGLFVGEEFIVSDLPYSEQVDIVGKALADLLIESIDRLPGLPANTNLDNWHIPDHIKEKLLAIAKADKEEKSE